MDMAFLGDFVINVYTLFLSLMLLFFQERGRKSHSSAAYIRLIGILAILVGVSAVRDIVSLSDGNFIFLSKLTSYLIYALDPFSFLFAIKYIDSFVTADDRSGRNLYINPIMIYAIFNFILVALDAHLSKGWFLISYKTGFERGSLYMLRLFMQIMSCAIIFAFITVYKSYIHKWYVAPIQALPAIVLTGEILQYFIPYINFAYASSVFAFMVLFIYVQRRDIHMDYLTGTVNRRGIDAALRKAMADSAENPFCAVMIDIDYFKLINDNFGHKVGDEVLEGIAAILLETFDKKDVVGRYGGDEFCIITHMTDELEIEKRIHQVKKLVEDFEWSNRGKMDLSVSAGIAVYSKEMEMHGKDFMEFVDSRMYEEKALHHLSKQVKVAAN
ncbi:MAG: diguanylate cyclase [Butyrivibrio sp.]|jgi:diguanylate cyclase (GGDEF)-like protein|nr:diguanylate cyclase [Butyrivibrio sp.]MBR4358637.1 diguanylate cyclase [Butyrivibrio sp.]